MTAAPTTAAFATGDLPGVTAAPTTAARATGAPITPGRPTRAARSMSLSFLGELGLELLLDGVLDLLFQLDLGDRGECGRDVLR